MDHRKQFALERMILFSDAVFAIAITLLIIEIKIPELHGGSQDAVDKLVHLIPKFFGFALGYLVIGIYWFSHHRLFGFVKDYNSKLIAMNLLLLFSIVMMPFTSGLYGENAMETVAYILYAANVIITGLLMTWLWVYVSNPKHGLSVGLEHPRLRRYYLMRSWGSPIIWTIGLLLALTEFWAPNVIVITISRSIYFLFGPYMMFVSRKFRDVPALLREANHE